MNLILLGAPGAGKGTQAEAICQRLQIPQISTGNILREAVKAGTELGAVAAKYIDDGKLVPEEVIIQLVRNRLSESDCQTGFILDGFPRTIGQADALAEMNVKIDRVLELVVDDAEIMQRLSGRRVCESCGASYHIEHNPSEKEGICDKCSGKTVLRKDDAPKTVAGRLKTYHEQTEPLESYYKNKGILTAVNSSGLTVEQTTDLVFKALGV